MLRFRSIAFFLILTSTTTLFAQNTATYYWDWTAIWNGVRYVNRPVSVDPDVSTNARTTGLGMGIFRLNNGLYNIAQAKALDAANYYGAMGPAYNTNPNYVGDHVDAIIRRDDGSYNRAIDFYAFPVNSYLRTLSDASVKQDPSDTLPGNLGTTESQGLNWQFGAGFTAILAPRLNTDPLNTQRVVAFFSAEAYPTDEGIAGHLIGFASRSVANSSTADPFTIPFSGTWKNASSYNDGESKLARGVPLNTLHLKNFTPVLAARADTGIRSPSIAGGRFFTGLAGWYSDGYYYLMTSTLLSKYFTQCGVYPTGHALGLMLVRFKADLTGSSGYGGLWLDSNGRPQVELYYSDTQNGTKYFHALPYPDRLLSFSDDNKVWSCSSPNRAQFSGCCNNPAVPAANAIIEYPNDGGFVGIPSSTFVGYNGCNRYVVLSSNNPPSTGNTEARILRLTDSNGACGAGNPTFTFAEAMRVSMPLPTGYDTDVFYRTVLPNFTIFNSTTLAGYRHVRNTSTGRHGQLPMTVAGSLP
jgi:hypothetical protein